LDGGTVCYGFIRVDTTVGLFAVEIVLDHLLDLGDTSGSSDKNDLIEIFLAHVCIFKYSLDWAKCLLEEITVELFEAGTCKRFTEINAINEGFNL